MGYDLHITRKAQWRDEGEDIPASEWQAVVAMDSSLKITGEVIGVTMTSSVPIVRQIAWLSVLPQLGILLVLIAIADLLGARDPFLAGAIAYVAASILLRFAIPRHHRRGLSLFKKERFSEAVPHFFRSYDFFVKHRWLDRWRAVTLLSSSRIGYTEMALLNAAFCLSQSRERDR